MAQTKMISKRYPCFRQQNVCHLGFQGGTKVAQVAHKVAQSRDQLLLSAKKSGQFSLGQSFITVDKVKTKRSVCGKGVLQGWLRFPRLGKIWSIFCSETIWSTFYLRRQSKDKRSVCGKGVLQGWLRFPRLGKIWSIFAWSTFYLRRQSKDKRSVCGKGPMKGCFEI